MFFVECTLPSTRRTNEDNDFQSLFFEFGRTTRKERSRSRGVERSCGIPESVSSRLERALERAKLTGVIEEFSVESAQSPIL